MLCNFTPTMNFFEVFIKYFTVTVIKAPDVSRILNKEMNDKVYRLNKIAKTMYFSLIKLCKNETHVI